MLTMLLLVVGAIHLPSQDRTAGMQEGQAPAPVLGVRSAARPDPADSRLFQERGAKHSYANLFRPLKPVERRGLTPELVVDERPSARVVCGLTVWQADPTIDPGMIMRADGRVEFPIRRIVPTVCQP